MKNKIESIVNKCINHKIDIEQDGNYVYCSWEDGQIDFVIQGDNITIIDSVGIDSYIRHWIEINL